jgi:hypothetical protein
MLATPMKTTSYQVTGVVSSVDDIVESNEWAEDILCFVNFPMSTNFFIFLFHFHQLSNLQKPLVLSFSPPPPNQYIFKVDLTSKFNLLLCN